MMQTKRASKRASTKGIKAPETVEQKLEKAYILPAQVGDQIKVVLMEMPYKYGQMVGPLLQALEQAYRSDITLNVPKNPPQLTGEKPQSQKAPVKPESKEKEDE